MKKGLIMEGGAMRGVFTCGVIDVFMENGIEFDGAAGISAGAVFGCNVKSRQIGRGIRYNKAYCKDPRYCSIRSLLTTGNIYNVDFCYHTLPRELDPFDDKTFAENPMEFFVGATDVNTGKPVFHRCSDGGETDMKWFQASASMPVVSRIVEVGGRQMLDGGIVCPVPYRFMETMGYKKNVLILTQAQGYRKKKPDLMTISRLMLHNYPELLKAIARRPRVYNRQMAQIDQDELRGKILVIRPREPLNIPRTESDPAELERVYQLGRREAERRLGEVKRYLGLTKKK